MQTEALIELASAIRELASELRKGNKLRPDSRVASSIGYSMPQPIEPKDEVADLMRSFNAAVELQHHLTARIEKAVARITR